MWLTQPRRGCIHTSTGLQEIRKSLVSSKLSQLLAMLGATLRRFGAIPLYNPLKPSCLIMVVKASQIDLYW